MTVRLRPHHLLCILTYIGKGYSTAFIANYDKLAARVGGGEDIVIVSGPDDICAPLLDDPDPHCLRKSVTLRDQRAAEGVGALLGQEIVAGLRLRLTAAHLTDMRKAFANGKTRAACSGCDWAPLCDTIAQTGFRDTRVQPNIAQ